MSKVYTRKDYDPYIGTAMTAYEIATLPNYEAVDPLLFLNDLASGGHMMLPVWGYALLPGEGRRSQWAQFFLTAGHNMSLALDGGGYVVSYGPPYPTPSPNVGRFAICKHEKEEGAGADHRRGWHPGKCKLCGMDMTIDSGD